MKKILSAMLTIAMLLALCVETASAAEFPDVPAGSAYAQAVQWVSQQGYINGYNDGRFGANDNVTRAQLAAILYRAAGSPAASGTTRFPDVASTAYYVNAASWTAAGGLINGYQDGRFGVNDPITRQQVTAIFWRWAGSPAASADDYADEAGISDYAKTAVDWARANNIVPAKNANRFAPADNATRGGDCPHPLQLHEPGQPVRNPLRRKQREGSGGLFLRHRQHGGRRQYHRQHPERQYL